MDYLLHIQNKNLLFHFSYIDISPMSKGVTLSFPVLSSLQKKKKKNTKPSLYIFNKTPKLMYNHSNNHPYIYSSNLKKKKKKIKKRKLIFIFLIASPSPTTPE